MITLRVLGTPAPKGSGRAMLIGGRARHIASGSLANERALKGWNVAVREAARSAVGNIAAPPFVGVPLAVRIQFLLARPAGHWGTGRNAGGLRRNAPGAPAGKPDLDKLARATLDSLTGIVFDDDSRIVELSLIKAYAVPGDEGASIAVAPAIAIAHAGRNIVAGIAE